MSISIKNVWKNYGDVPAVRDLNLDCGTGRMLALLGPSGCGKSTTLKMVAGIEEVTSGEIWFGDREVSTLPPGSRNIAMVFEDYALYMHLSVFENIAFPLRLRHLPDKEVKQRVGTMLDLLRLGSIANEKVRHLSGGAQQRVAIGRALVRDPDVILFDEPLSHIDADQKAQLRTEIKRLQQTQGLTSILVTHDQTEAIAMSDAIAVMNHGVLQQVGSPQDLYTHPANTFVATFIGEPPMNLLNAAVEEEGGILRLRGAGWSLVLSEEKAALVRQKAIQSLTVGLRPEHFSLANGDASRSTGKGRLSGEVYFREHRGDTDVLLLDIDAGTQSADHRVSADIPGPSALREGDRVELSFDDSRLCLFDADSGRNLLF
ncbi:Trehalose import ATP-binding protein SugC [Hartmannibacter diazotrophicus]|uniref:Trehalose import ATP-binding protein SugC n=1 Tax=Hartmannibacter diazotrophicus TaxID=1482074 RepID=A0A2C9D5R9_9HYPH|nr:ABC transporter ATP-binding protein [Hartmannibacter diazotrophicus]SON55682.1 Trehalose import ATP-binding protein SugC [Hartmannibacter diazotrophicus]